MPNQNDGYGAMPSDYPMGEVPRSMEQTPKTGDKVTIWPSDKTRGVSPGTEGEVDYVDHHVSPEYQPVKPTPTYDVTIPASGQGDTKQHERTLRDLEWGKDIGWPGIPYTPQ